MTFFKSALSALVFALATPAVAADTIIVTDAYARFMPGGKAGAAFMMIENTSDTDDRLLDAASESAARVELHTHKAGEGGMMQMLHVPEGFSIPAHGKHALARGGDHVMLMGPVAPIADGDTVTVTLTFEKAGDVVIDIPVDNARAEVAPAN